MISCKSSFMPVHIRRRNIVWYCQSQGNSICVSHQSGLIISISTIEINLIWTCTKSMTKHKPFLLSWFSLEWGELIWWDVHRLVEWCLYWKFEGRKESITALYMYFPSKGPVWDIYKMAYHFEFGGFYCPIFVSIFVQNLRINFRNMHHQKTVRRCYHL